MRRIEPIPGLVRPAVILVAVDLDGDDAGVIPGPVLLIRTVIVVQSGCEINGQGGLIANRLYPMPVVPRNSD